MDYSAYAAERLGAASFQTAAGDPRTDLFHTSLESCRGLFGWTARGKNRAGQRFSLQAGFVDDRRPNALADYWGSEHFIGMHSSLFVAINEFAMFCFTQGEFFPDVGTPARETSPKPWDERVPGIWLLDHTSKGGRVREEHSARLIPRDGERYIASIYLAQLMARLVWLHELAHAFNGHVRFAAHHGLRQRLYELEHPLPAASVVKSRSREEDAETLRCLEFDADQSALWASCNIQLRRLENIEGIAALNAGLRLRLTLFGAYAMTWLIDRFQDYLDTQGGETHPPPSLRLQNMFRTVATNILPLDPALEALHAEVRRQFDVVGAAIPGVYGSKEMAARSTDPALMAALAASDPRAADLKAELQDFEYGEHG